MYKSLHIKRFFSLAILSALFYSMTLAAAYVVPPSGDTDEPNNGVVGNTSNEPTSAVVPVQVKPFLTEELVDLVAPVALYPDDLLAIVLPAAVYPIQIVQAARFLEELKNDDSLQPNEAWDESVVALLNYPEVIELLNNDLEWTWKLGEAVLNQESEVIQAVETFRDRAMLAGNLKTDEYQTVNNEDGTIEITPVDPEVIYVPYYEPERVVVYQPYPVYHYYERPYPVYYYPYPVGYNFGYGFFWGITTAFTIGWHSHHLNVHYWDYYSHPYYGHTYYSRHHYYHGPSHHYAGHSQAGYGQHYGDHWQPRGRYGDRPVYRDRQNDRHGDNRVVSTTGGARFKQVNTFKSRPGFKGKMISANTTRTGEAVRSTVDKPAALTRDSRRTARYGETRQNKPAHKTDLVSQTPHTTGKAKRNRLDREKERRDSSRVSIAQNKSTSEPVSRSANSQDRIKKRTLTSNKDRKVSQTSRTRVVRKGRSNPDAGVRSVGRVTNTLAYSSGSVAKSSPQPRQSQRPVSRPQASRSAPAASRKSSPPKSNRGISKANVSHGRSNSNGSRGNSNRQSRDRRQ